jgi:hypothetical protein
VDWGEVDGLLIKADALCGIPNGASEWNDEGGIAKAVGSWCPQPLSITGK